MDRFSSITEGKHCDCAVGRGGERESLLFQTTLETAEGQRQKDHCQEEQHAEPGGETASRRSPALPAPLGLPGQNVVWKERSRGVREGFCGPKSKRGLGSKVERKTCHCAFEAYHSRGLFVKAEQNDVLFCVPVTLEELADLYWCCLLEVCT